MIKFWSYSVQFSTVLCVEVGLDECNGEFWTWNFFKSLINYFFLILFLFLTLNCTVKCLKKKRFSYWNIFWWAWCYTNARIFHFTWICNLTFNNSHVCLHDILEGILFELPFYVWVALSLLYTCGLFFRLWWCGMG